MAKLTLTDGTIFEGTAEEIFAITERFSGTKADEPLIVGDYVTVTSLGMSTGFRRSDVSLGDIGKIIEIDRSKVPYRFERQFDGFVTWFAEGKLTRATEEEVAEAKSLVEQSAKDAVFTQARRKPNEYRKGDIVKFEYRDYRNYSEVTEVCGDKVYFYDTSCGNKTEFSYISSGTLSPITFVENRLDRN